MNPLSSLIEPTLLKNKHRLAQLAQLTELACGRTPQVRVAPHSLWVDPSEIGRGFLVPNPTSLLLCLDFLSIPTVQQPQRGKGNLPLTSSSDSASYLMALHGTRFMEKHPERPREHGDTLELCLLVKKSEGCFEMFSCRPWHSNARSFKGAADCSV